MKIFFCLDWLSTYRVRPNILTAITTATTSKGDTLVIISEYFTQSVLE